ncbi:unnamed protein product [Rhodiola kirilowii]
MFWKPGVSLNELPPISSHRQVSLNRPPDPGGTIPYEKLTIAGMAARRGRILCYCCDERLASGVGAVLDKNGVGGRNAHKVFDMLLRVNAESKMFDKRVEVVDYVEENGIEIEERACMMLLLALKRAGQVDMSLKFFCQMVDANVPIAVYSMAISVDGLCRKGETDQARVLIDDMSCLGFKGNPYSYNTLICAYIKTGDFVGVDEKEAAERLAGVLNDGSFYSIKGKNKHRLWLELCDLLTKHVTEVSELNVDAIIRGGIRRFTDEVGRLWTSLADYYIRRNQTDEARDVLSEGMTTVLTVRDFSVIFDAYSQLEESMLALRMENIDLDDLSIWWKISGVFTS